MQIPQLKVLVPNIFQNEALRILENTKKDKGVIVMPTGTGKTFLASLWFKKQLESNSKAKLLFICHNKDILSQANEKEFQVCLKELDVTYGYYNGEEKNIQQATFGTVQTLVRNLDKFDKELFDYIIVDEAHHYQARTFKKVIEHFKPKFILGLTATPNRKDNKSIFKLLGDKLYEVKVSEAIKNNLLTKINYWCVDNDIDFSNIKWNGSNYDEKDLNRIICVKEYDDAILKEYNETLREKFGKKKTICFCATVEHTYRMAKLFNDNGIKAVGLTGKYFKKDYRVTIHENQRDKIIEGFKNGDYDIIFVRDLFNEGVDIPDCDSIMMLRPTESHTIFTQQLGRGLRVSEGKDNVLILDFTGNAKRCIINFEVLGEMIDLDIVKEIKNKPKEEIEKNEIIFLSNNCEVRLNRRKFYLFKRNRNSSQENIVETFRRLKKKLGRIPTKGEMFIEFGYKIDFNYIFLLKSLGENTKGLIAPSKEEIIKEYFELKKKLGRQPKIIELRANGVYIPKYFGSAEKFYKEIGEPYRLQQDKVSKDKLIKEYFKVKKKIGKQPTSNLFSSNKVNGIKYTLKKYEKVFGGWNEFLKGIKEPLNQNNVFAKDVSKRQLIDNYLNLKKKLNKHPTSIDIKVKNGSKYGIEKYMTKFGSMDNFFKEIKEPYRELNIPKEVLVRELRDKAQQLGHIPNLEEFGNRWHTLTKFYGNSWSNTIKDVFGKDCNYKFTNIKKEVSCVVCKRKFTFRKSGNYRNKDKLCCSKLCSNRYISKMVSERNKKRFTKEDTFIEYERLEKELGRRPKQKDFNGKTTKFSASFIADNLGGLRRFRKQAEQWIKDKSNIKITSSYIPKTIILPVKQKRKGLHKEYKGMNKIEYKSKEDKVNIREKIIGKINDGDLVLLLESPELSALKEIEKQGKKPSKIIIPNNFEFNKIVEALKNYKTNLNIELINTSALQYLVDSEEKFDFIWLDYCGAFSFYMKDLDILFQKHLSNMRLVLTYNLFDPAKEDDSYYFTRVIDYVLSKTEDKKVRLLNDITYRYKKNMYNIGFNIQEVIK